MKFKKYTKELLEDVISTSFSLRETLNKLGVIPAGGNYQTLHKAIAFYKFDTCHFTGQSHLKGKTHTHRLRPLKDILIYGKYENTFHLKLRLIKEGIKKKLCERCSLITWGEVPIPLELHHVDGDRKNNQLSNLELLCPNCHALTVNYRGKNKKV